MTNLDTSTILGNNNINKINYDLSKLIPVDGELMKRIVSELLNKDDFNPEMISPKDIDLIEMIVDGNPELSKKIEKENKNRLFELVNRGFSTKFAIFLLMVFVFFRPQSQNIVSADETQGNVANISDITNLTNQIEDPWMKFYTEIIIDNLMQIAPVSENGIVNWNINPNDAIDRFNNGRVLEDLLSNEINLFYENASENDLQFEISTILENGQSKKFILIVTKNQLSQADRERMQIEGSGNIDGIETELKIFDLDSRGGSDNRNAKEVARLFMNDARNLDISDLQISLDVLGEADGNKLFIHIGDNIFELNSGNLRINESGEVFEDVSVLELTNADGSTLEFRMQDNDNFRNSLIQNDQVRYNIPQFFRYHKINPEKLIEGIKSGIIGTVFISPYGGKDIGIEFINASSIPEILNANPNIESVYVGTGISDMNAETQTIVDEIESISREILTERYPMGKFRLYQRVFYDNNSRREMINIRVDIIDDFRDVYLLDIVWEKKTESEFKFTLYYVNTENGSIDIMPLDISEEQMAKLEELTEQLYETTDMSSITELIHQ